MKTLTVFDFYENPFGEAIYVTHDMDDCRKFCEEYAKAVDGECNLRIKED